ncbi:hypothetical protein [Streptomyces sp. NPDC092952]
MAETLSAMNYVDALVARGWCEVDPLLIHFAADAPRVYRGFDAG